MISSIPDITFKTAYEKHPKSLDELFDNINSVLTEAPEFNNTILVGTPLSAALIWTMGSPEGFAAYRRLRINKMFGKVLEAYKKFLDSKESRYVLNKSQSGWFGKEASKKIDMSEYQHSPNKPYYGFKSWNDFFTRKLVKGARPVMEPLNNKVINSACDSTIYRISFDVKAQDDFWIKSQPYSLNAMLNGEKKYVKKFEGGCVYQAFLNPFNYHRWHSPINGTIEKAYVKQGLYFTQDNSMKEDKTDQDMSEGYLTNVETRAIIYIRADDETIGTVCVMPVGMVEIASCNINKNIKPGKRVKKGDELGYFAYGGSTHCLIFEPNVIKKFTHKKGDFVPMGQIIAEIN
jgi:phosphatidylserine decarboxylase